MTIPKTELSASRFRPAHRWWHWLSAVLVLGLFGLGSWMSGLTYYDSLYHVSRDWHRSIGLLLIGMTIVRLAYRFWRRPGPSCGGVWERRLAPVVHWLMYGLLLFIMAVGLLMSVGDGELRLVAELTWSVPLQLSSERIDQLHELHEIGSDLLMLLVVVHTLAAVKHHFIDRDDTLLAMFKSER